MVLLSWPKVELAISLVFIMPSGSYSLGQGTDVKVIPSKCKQPQLCAKSLGLTPEMF